MNKEARYSVVNGQNALTANGRFCEMAAVSPQKGQWGLGSSYPAASSVEAATSQSRHHVRCNVGQCAIQAVCFTSAYEESARPAKPLEQD